MDTARIMRVFRVFRFFRQLANWAMMILDSLKSLFGALILLGLWEAVYGGYMGAIWGYEFGDVAKMLGLDDWIANIVPFCGGFAALSDFLMDPFLVAGFSSENSGGRTEHPCAEKRSFGVLDGRWDLHGSTSDII